MSKKRGFTLTEVLVVIAITTLIMTMLGTTFVFMATSSGDLIHKSEELTQTQSIETYLRSLIATNTKDKNDPDYNPEYINSLITVYENGKVKIENCVVYLDNGNIYLNADGVNGSTQTDKVEFKDTGLTCFRIYNNGSDDPFIRCELTYEKNNTKYEFILGLLYVKQSEGNN